jgi:hypothetical protein
MDGCLGQSIRRIDGDTRRVWSKSRCLPGVSGVSDTVLTRSVFALPRTHTDAYREVRSQPPRRPPLGRCSRVALVGVSCM